MSTILDNWLSIKIYTMLLYVNKTLIKRQNQRKKSQFLDKTMYGITLARILLLYNSSYTYNNPYVYCSLIVYLRYSPTLLKMNMPIHFYKKAAPGRLFYLVLFSAIFIINSTAFSIDSSGIYS